MHLLAFLSSCINSLCVRVPKRKPADVLFEYENRKLTGNLSDVEKKAAVIGWVQQFVFDTITLLTDFPADDPARLTDPDKGTFFWSDEDGTKNPSGLFITGREIILVDFDETALATDELSATIRKA